MERMSVKLLHSQIFVYIIIIIFVVYETAKDLVLASDTCADRAIKSTGYVLNHRLPLKARLSKAAACTFFL